MSTQDKGTMNCENCDQHCVQCAREGLAREESGCQILMGCICHVTKLGLDSAIKRKP